MSVTHIATATAASAIVAINNIHDRIVKEYEKGLKEWSENPNNTDMDKADHFVYDVDIDTELYDALEQRFIAEGFSVDYNTPVSDREHDTTLSLWKD
jgi:hypothetical protein